MVYIKEIDLHVKEIVISKVKYVLEKVVGRGAFGIVVRARDVATDVVYAIKIIPIPENMVEEDKQECIQRVALEVSAFQQFRHVKNVTFLRNSQYGKLKNGWLAFFLVMEFCQKDFKKYFLKRYEKVGEERVKAGKPVLKEKEIGYWVTQLVSALNEMYNFNYMHRDLKFENLLLAKKNPEELEDEVKKKKKKKKKKLLFDDDELEDEDEDVKKQEEIMTSILRNEKKMKASEMIKSFHKTSKLMVLTIDESGVLKETKEEKEGDEDSEDEKSKLKRWERWTLKLCDFGMAKKLKGKVDLTTTFCGNFASMSPDILSGKSYSYTSDLWALGVLVLKMVTGDETTIYKDLNQMDFVNRREKALIDLIAKFDLKKILAKFSISSDLKDLLRKLLNKESDKRISFAELMEHPFITGNKKKVEKQKKDQEDVQLLELLKKNSDAEVFADVNGILDCTPWKKRQERMKKKKGDKEEKKKDITEEEKVEMDNIKKGLFQKEFVFDLKPGKFQVHVFNLKNSSWIRFYLSRLEDINLENKSMETKTKFEKDLKGKYVEKTPLSCEISVMKKTSCKLYVRLRPSWWTKYWENSCTYRLVILKKKEEYSLQQAETILMT